MKNRVALIVAVLALSVGCSVDVGRDAALEAEVTSMIEAREVIAMSAGPQTMLNISSDEAFEMADADLDKIATAIAYVALEGHPNTESIMIAFGRTDPRLEQTAYVFRNEDGVLVQVQELNLDN